MTHISLDLETWGKRPGCDIRSIGAVVFDPLARTVGISETDKTAFYIATDNPITEDGVYQTDYFWDGVGEYRKYPLSRDPETVQWWNEQSDEARAAFADPVDLRDALWQFGRWTIEDVMSGDGAHMEQPTLKVWANDPHFDVSILDAVYRAVGLPVPWHYRAPRSMKTVCDLANITREDMQQFNHGTAHNALDDAISQAMIVCEAYKRLGLQK